MSLPDARQYLLNRAPYFASLLFKLVPIFTEEVKTLAVSDQMHLFINRAYLDSKTVPEQGFLLWHETMHVVTTFAVADMLGSTVDTHVLNLAADAYINDVGRRQNWTIPADLVFPETFNLPVGMSQIWYYQELMKNPPPKKEGGCGAGNCGAKDELTQRHSNLGRSKEEKRESLRRFAEGMPSRERGTFPGLVDDLLRLTAPKSSLISWKEHLRNSLFVELTRMRGIDRFTFSKPHKRSYVDDGIILPSGMEERTEFEIIVDTSGSMDESLLAASCREAAAAMDSVNLDECTLHQADMVIADSRRLSAEDLRKASFAFKGRGGTSFHRPITEAMERNPEIGLLLYLTDGYGDAPPPTPFPIVWGLFTEAEPLGPGVVVRIKPLRSTLGGGFFLALNAPRRTLLGVWLVDADTVGHCTAHHLLDELLNLGSYRCA